MDRADFVEGYMTRSGLMPYSTDGERVTHSSASGDDWVLHALECRCCDDNCAGWAMIPDGSQNWHRFQNGLTDMTFEEACAADLAIKAALVKGN